jgi:hypothetical protein
LVHGEFDKLHAPADFKRRFQHYFAVHETEAWFLAQPSLFPEDIQKRIEANKKSPEQVNFNNPPAKNLKGLYHQLSGTSYKKTTNASNFFPKLDAENAMARCPYLKEMMHELREMAREFGATPKGTSHLQIGDSV